MPKIKKLVDPTTGQTVYPVTIAKAVFDEDGRPMNEKVGELAQKITYYKGTINTPDDATSIGIYYVSGATGTPRGLMSYALAPVHNYLTQVMLSANKPIYDGSGVSWRDEPCVIARQKIGGSWTNWESISSNDEELEALLLKTSVIRIHEGEGLVTKTKTITLSNNTDFGKASGQLVYKATRDETVTFNININDGYQLLEQVNGVFSIRSYASIDTTDPAQNFQWNKSNSSKPIFSPTLTAKFNLKAGYEVYVLDRINGTATLSWQERDAAGDVPYISTDDVFDDYGTSLTELLKKKEEGEEEIETKLNLNIYPVQNCTLGSSGWYMNGSIGRHRAIPVNEGEKYELVVDAASFYGLLTDDYNPPYKSYDSIPYVEGTDRIVVRQVGHANYNGRYIVVVPKTAKYLVICTVDGSGNSINWEVIKYSKKGDEQQPSQQGVSDVFTKFRYAHWNVGHWSYYDGKSGTSQSSITPDIADVMRVRYRKAIHAASPDIIGVAEYDPRFTTDGNLAKDEIFGCFDKKFEGTKYAYNCNSIFVNGINVLSRKQKQYTNKSQIRYYTALYCKIAGKDVVFVETHFDFDNAQYRLSQMQEVINDMSGYDYVVIAGDFNISSSIADEELKPFTDAGYTKANGGYIGYFSTIRNPVSGMGYLDHIMVKGFAVSNANSMLDTLDLSDHSLIYCDLVML